MKCGYCGGENENGRGACIYCEKPFGGQAAAGAAAPTAESGNVKPSATAETVLAGIDFMNAETLVKLGKTFLTGVGGEVDFSVSYRLFYKGALKGDAEAMLYLARQLERGQGVPADFQNALWWYVQAAKTGSTEARMVLAESMKAELPMQAEAEVTDKNARLKSAVMKVRPFCVEISALSGGSYDSSGSGCLISPELLMTNAHVVIDKSTGRPHKEISFRFHQSVGVKGKQIIEVAACDAAEDIAICRLAGGAKVQAEAFPQFVDAHSLSWGDEVFTIGNALGRGLALSFGVIAKDIEYNAYGKSEVLQTDMSINGGNSGGALFDLDGNIAGLMTFVPCDSTCTKAYGMSYAVTSNTAVKFFQ